MNTSSKVLKAPLTSLRLVREGTVEYGEPVTRAAIAYSFLRPLMADLAQEAFYVVGLDTKNRITVVHQVAMGSPMGVAFNLGDVAKVLLLSNSTGVLCAHNHPSQSCDPSPEDRELTRRLREIMQLIGVRMIDHIIVADSRFYSFEEAGQL